MQDTAARAAWRRVCSPTDGEHRCPEKTTDLTTRGLALPARFMEITEISDRGDEIRVIATDYALFGDFVRLLCVKKGGIRKFLIRFHHPHLQGRKPDRICRIGVPS